MLIEECKHCALRSQKNNELTRHIEICSLRLERERCRKQRYRSRIARSCDVTTVT